MGFRVAIIGRPNVGKSTLFNRLVGRRLALVDDTPGVTRDRREGVGRFGPWEFTVIDTAGLEESDPDSLTGRMRRQTETAIDDADVALFVIDGRAGIMPIEKQFAQQLRRKGVPVVLAANKSEGRKGEAGMMEAYELGLGDPLPISAEHNEGILDLVETLAAAAGASFEDEEPEKDTILVDAPVTDEDGEVVVEEEAPRSFRLAIVGRPNVGKSTLVNRLIGEDRLLTGPEAGITRDSIDVTWTVEGRTITLTDTAGLRRKARIDEKLEKLSVSDSVRSIRESHVVVLVIDATMPLEKQDLTIAKLITDEGRAIVLAVNKWDMVENRSATMKAIRDRIQTSLVQVRGLTVVTLSAATGDGVNKLLPGAVGAFDRWTQRIGTPALNRWLKNATSANPPPAVQGRRIKIRYMTQARVRPPTFVLFTSTIDDLPESYIRYLGNSLREEFDLAGVPLRFALRKGENPYADK